MIKTLIIEDENAAAERITRLLNEADHEIEITGISESVSSAVDWLKNNDSPDLIILDIQLADGVSFEIFKQVKVESFVIFTTAYDEYAIKAFELNSIDYLLKPIQPDKLKLSIAKYKRLTNSERSLDIESVLKALYNKTIFKERFLINFGSKIKSVHIDEIAYFYSVEKLTFLCMTEDKHYPLEHSLNSIENMVDPSKFFRINRQFLINFSALDKIHVLSKSRIKIELKPVWKDNIYISKAKTHEFRNWLDK